MRANETYSEAKCQFKDRKRDVRMNVQLPHKWWPTRKSVVFSSSLSLPPLVCGGGGLGCELVGKADLLSDQFDHKQSRDLFISRSRATDLLVLPPLPSGQVRSGGSW